MKTFNFEVQLIKQLDEQLAEHYPGLVLVVPRPNWGNGGATPDLVIENIRTGDKLAIEVKGGSTFNSVPSASISSLIAMKSFGKMQGEKGDTSVWLVTSAFVPDPLKQSLAAENIHVVQSQSVEEALGELELPLSKLASQT